MKHKLTLWFRVRERREVVIEAERDLTKVTGRGFRFRDERQDTGFIYRSAAHMDWCLPDDFTVTDLSPEPKPPLTPLKFDYSPRKDEMSGTYEKAKYSTDGDDMNECDYLLDDYDDFIFPRKPWKTKSRVHFDLILAAMGYKRAEP